MLRAIVKWVFIGATLSSPMVFAQDGAANTREVRLYVDANYGRFHKSYSLGGNAKVLAIQSLEDGYGDEISSIKVGKGVKVTLFTEAGLNGLRLPLYEGEYKNLRDWSDHLDSLKIEEVDPDLPLITLHYGDNDYQKIGLTKDKEFYGDDNFLVENGAVSVDVPEAYLVTLYQHPGFEGHSNQEPITATSLQLRTIGLDDNLSSLKIEWKQYELVKTDIGKPKVLRTLASETIGGNNECENPSSAKIVCVKEVTASYEASYTTSWDNSTTTGLTVSTTATATAGEPGVGSVSLETSIAASIANTLSFGKSESSTTSQTFTDKCEVQLDPGQRVNCLVIAVPQEIEYDVEYTYAPVDKNGANKVVRGKIIVKKATSTRTVATDMNSPATGANTTATTDTNTPAGAVTTNVAFNKSATQSSTAYGGLASYAVNGNTTATYNPDPNLNDISHTDDGEDNWWEVDLGSVYDIDEIVVWNRNEVAWERLQNFYVMVSETPIQSNSTTDNVFSGPHFFTDPNHPAMIIEGNKRGRYVRIFLKDSNEPLHLGEVQVLGR